MSIGKNTLALLLTLAMFLTAGLSVAWSSSTPIAVANGSFETPVVTNPAAWANTLITFPTTSWNASAANYCNIANPSIYPSATGDGFTGKLVPDGLNCAFVGPNRDIWQQLPANLEAGYRYRISLRVGARLATGNPNQGYQVALIVGDSFSSTQSASAGVFSGSRTGTWTYLAQNDQTTNMRIPAPGAWLTVDVNGDADALDASWIGKPIWVVIHANNTNTQIAFAAFDNIVVTRTPVSEPIATTVYNGSFESPVATTWASTNITNATTGWNASVTTAPIWCNISRPSLYTGPAGSDGFTGQLVPDGLQCGLLGPNRDIWQQLPANLEAGYRYTVSLNVGSRLAGGNPNQGYQVALIVGDSFSSTQSITAGEFSGSRTGNWTYLAQNSQTTNMPIPAAGSWLPITVAGDADALDASWLGKPIWIVLHTNNTNTANVSFAAFDNIVVSRAVATEILPTVTNGSFEAGSVYTTAYYHPVLENGVEPKAWHEDDAGYGVMLMDDSTSGDPFENSTIGMPDGHKCAVSNGSMSPDLWQILPASLVADQKYTVSAVVGTRVNMGTPTGYEVALVVGDFSGGRATEGTAWVYLARNDHNNMPVAASGTWLGRVSASGNSAALDPQWIGQPVTVLLAAEGPGSVLFDDVKVGIGVVEKYPDVISYSDEVVVDGLLNDWDGADWAAVNTAYYPRPLVNSDMSDAEFAWKWGAGGTKVYLAVKVKDTNHSFTDAFAKVPADGDGGWNDSDRLEMQIWASSLSGVYEPNEAIAQQYTIGLRTDLNGAWSFLGGYGTPPSDTEFACDASVSGDWIYYEAAMTPFQYYGQIVTPAVDNIPRNLVAGDIIGTDAVIDSLNGANFNMISANEMANKYHFTTAIATHSLIRTGVNGTITLQNYGASTLRAGAGIVITDAGNVSETHDVVLDGSGNYSFNTALSGNCTAVASATGYQPQSLPVTVVAGEGTVNFTLTKLAEAVSVNDAKKKAVGSYVSLSGSITAVFSDSIYIETIDRFSGIRIDKASHGFVVGDVGKIVNVTGSVAKDPVTQESCINADVISPTTDVNLLQPLGLTNKAMGGGNFVDVAGNGQIGVDQGTGLNNIGLLVRTTGLASNGNADGFTLTDGSGVTVQVALAGAGSTYDGDYVIVTGISSIGSGGVRVIKARTVNDVQSVN